MVNKTLFRSTSKTTQKANTVNEAGGIAYSKTAKQALATMACVGTFNGVFYSSGQDLLTKIKELCSEVDDEFIAKLAIYARKSAFMKDTTSYLTAVLAARKSKLFPSVFEKVIDNGKMLRNFFQIARSGEAGRVINLSNGQVRKSIGKWFEKDPTWIFKNSIGSNPSIGDILRMARPKPITKEHASLFAYIRGTKLEGTNYVTRNKEGGVMYSNSFENLPTVVKQLENLKKTQEGEIPDVDFRLLDSVLNEEGLKQLWERQINGGWHLLRMNLNNFKKYGVFNNKENVLKVANRLKSKEEIKKNKVFPYQLLNTFINTDAQFEIKEALQDALDIAVENVPEIGKGFVCVDTSGSMQSPVTGNSAAPSKVTCVDVAGLIASSILKVNKDSEVVPFDTQVRSVQINPRDSVMTNSRKLALNGGGTNIACSIEYLNINNKIGDYIVIISDNESWMGVHGSFGRTGTMEAWLKFKRRNPNAKLICIDLQPYITSQVKLDKDILLVAGFSDSVYTVIQNFLQENSDDFWIKEIEKTII